MAIKDGIKPPSLVTGRQQRVHHFVAILHVWSVLFVRVGGEADANSRSA
eukprot:CAMPEP_0204054824 /NCGR_PEP_ID=MMETSP0360-20130528/129327_1 /ASSEMBLY_ACC=CAM_ASM_000342 /TAXON_ID=268821 /ORGANISM="Scrippsiella Hangoei, Strain SHTV-5" /LENGTH=48 /DNA_ID= /DNA_START= /DNA_END= /DNA_ORIENTATION=